MHLLKFDTFELHISDFVYHKELFYFDLKFDSKESFELFDSFYCEHHTDESSFNYEFDNISYFGRFGALTYDLNYNMRLYLLTAPFDSKGYADYNSVLDYNIPKILNNHEKRINVLIDVLLDKGLLTKDDTDVLSSFLTPTIKGIDLSRQVDDLNSYLESTLSTLDDLRNNFKNR